MTRRMPPNQKAFADRRHLLAALGRLLAAERQVVGGLSSRATANYTALVTNRALTGWAV